LVRGLQKLLVWADGFERMVPHLAARDTTLVAISRAPLPKLEAFKAADGLDLQLVVLAANDFNYDLRRFIYAGGNPSAATRSTISEPPVWDRGRARHQCVLA